MLWYVHSDEKFEIAYAHEASWTSYSTFFHFFAFFPARLNLKFIKLSYFNRYSCACRYLEGNSSLSSSHTVHCGPRKIWSWRALFGQNMACLVSLLSKPLRDSLKRPTAVKTMNGELWSTVENRRGDEIMRKNKQEKIVRFWFFVGLLESFHIALPMDFSCKRELYWSMSEYVYDFSVSILFRRN